MKKILSIVLALMLVSVAAVAEGEITVLTREDLSLIHIWFQGISACQKRLFDKLVDGGASSPATATPSISFR